jgi:serine phosphatase RsbU (regulator of sigma subunit)
VWLIVGGASLAAAVVLSFVSSSEGAGCAQALAVAIACVSVVALLVRGLVLAFRAIIRRLALRLAFSYFLIGIVPIPLLAALLFAGAYLVANQIVATRVQREIAGAARELAASPDRASLPGFATDENGTIVSSDVPWLTVGSPAPWAKSLTTPRALIDGRDAWMAVRAPLEGPGRFVLVALTDPEGGFERRIEERTHYRVTIQVGTSRKKRGLEISVRDRERAAEARRPPRPDPFAPTGRGLLDMRWVAGVYVDTPAAAFHTVESGHHVVLYLGRTSPRVLFDQLFAQGIPEVSRVFWGVFISIGAALLVVYLVALAIAFTLVGNLARNVHRLVAASEAFGRGDFSVRVNSRSRDQVGDVARSFDKMASSIQDLLVETARKERLESEIAIARTIQQKLLPPAESELPGLALRARFEPVAEIGGDYYDYARAPDGRSVVALGDVSGHGLSTGLLVAMAKAGLLTLLESGFKETALFIKLNELIHRSTDSRNYMTLALFAYDPASRTGSLTNAGQLAPYRLSKEGVESLSLPSFPLGMSPRYDFPTRAWTFSAGDRLVLLTDGLVEASDPAGEPFGFERLETLLAQESASDASRLEQAILEAVRAHTEGAPPEDDRTLVVVTLA